MIPHRGSPASGNHRPHEWQSRDGLYIPTLMSKFVDAGVKYTKFARIRLSTWTRTASNLGSGAMDMVLISMNQGNVISSWGSENARDSRKSSMTAHQARTVPHCAGNQSDSTQGHIQPSTGAVKRDFTSIRWQNCSIIQSAYEIPLSGSPAFEYLTEKRGRACLRIW